MTYFLSDNILSPLGKTSEENYKNIKLYKSSLKQYNNIFDYSNSFTASLFSQEDKNDFFIEGFTSFESMVIYSVEQAINKANFDIKEENVIFILSSTKGNINLLNTKNEDTKAIYLSSSVDKIAKYFHLKNSPIVVCNACTSGASAIILAHRLLEKEKYDYAVVCGAEEQSKFIFSGFQSLQALSPFECKPFDINRLGLNLGEASATVVLCNEKVKCKHNLSWSIKDGAIRNDSSHITNPSKNGTGLTMALSAVIEQEDLNDIASINVHGTATMFNDQMEAVAVENVGINNIPLNTFKGYFGHTMGASGIFETIISIHALNDKTILATKGFEEIGVSGKVTLLTKHQTSEKNSFIKTSSGFGGVNTAILITKNYFPQTAKNINFKTTHSISISPNELVIDNHIQQIQLEEKDIISYIYKTFINDYPKFHKMDYLSQLGFVGSEILLQKENASRFIERENRAIIFFNNSSSIDTDKKYYQTICDKESFYPSPSLFVYTLPNIVTGEIALRNKYHGESSFYILSERNEHLMKQILEVSFLDKKTTSILCGWIDYANAENFNASLQILELEK